MSSLFARTFLAFTAVIRTVPFERGKNRILLPLLKNLAWLKPGLQGLSFHCTQADVRWSADSFPDIMTRTMLLSGTYQEEVIAALSALVKPGDLVFDVGAHHGLMSIHAGRLTGPAGRVVAFEPNPQSKPVLAGHLSLNGITNVTIESTGLMDRESVEPFYANRGTCSWNSTFIRDFAADLARDLPIEIRTTTLDRYCEEKNCLPSLIKIDTEGSEFLILNGSRTVLEKARPHLILEFNPISARSAGVTLQEIAAALRSLGYELFVMPRNTLGHYAFEARRRVTDADLSGDGLQNVICVSEKREH